MLRITIPGDEVYDELAEQFSTIGDLEIDLEHSLVSLSKWESKYQVPFLSNGKKAPEEIFDYVKMMILTPNLPSNFITRLTDGNIRQINDYIESKQSATTFGQMPERKGRGETITAELIYYWMVAFNIPFECQYWHLNRLFALIRICNIKNSKPKKMSRHDIAARNRDLNAQRRALLNTNG
jgi:hypothetical protein